MDDDLLNAGYAALRRGDADAALGSAQRLLRKDPSDVRAIALLGMAKFRKGDLAGSIAPLEQTLRTLPGHEEVRSNLAYALLSLARYAEARAVAAVAPAVRFQRIAAFANQREGRTDAAIAGYHRVLRALATDYESWNNLGLLLAEKQGIGPAIDAFQRAVALAPGFADARINLSTTLAGVERHIERRDMLRALPVDLRHHPDLLVQLGLAEGATGDFAAAEDAYRRALASDPAHVGATLEYGMLLEKLNRLDDLDDLIRTTRAHGLAGGSLDFLEAWLNKRRGRFPEAASLAARATGAVAPARLAQLIGEISDRLCETDRAFEAFSEMNAYATQGAAARFARARDLPGEIMATIARTTPKAVAGWSTAISDLTPPPPIFIVGFPRSGTTLLDTLLMNVRTLQVMEEFPIVEQVETMIGGPDRLDHLSTSELAEHRQRYFQIVKELVPEYSVDIHIVDKLPLNLIRVTLIHRLFPDARFVLVERHPCDVVLSCFMARFQVNRATVHLNSLLDAARLYALALEAWTRAEELLPLAVHRVRYERLVTDAEGEIRPLLRFLDIAWDAAILDHVGSAARRRHIATPSYAQVIEPMYGRASGRWRRYARYFDDVLPILEPWIRRAGYAA